jgi:DNA-binding transcriptional regulator YiaG
MTPAQLYALRQTLELSQPEMGYALGRTAETICRYERGDRAIPRIVELACRGLAAELLAMPSRHVA